MREDPKNEKRIRLDCAGRAPELIGYMAMSIRLTPSLTRAVTFAAKNMEGPVGSGLKRIIWSVYTRRFHSVEESYTATATEWGRWNDDLKRAMFSVRTSTLEGTDDGRERSLNKAMDTVLSGTKKRMEEFASSLSTPTTVLFALGILLPMMLGAMLPMVSLGGLDLSYQAASTENMSGGGIHPALVVLLMDVVFPLAALLYALNILSGRPGGGSRMADRLVLKRARLVILTLIGVGVVALCVLHSETFGSYGIIWGIAFPPAAYLMSTTWGSRKRMRKVQRMEEEFPDALFQLGTRMSEGSPPERAMLETASSMKDAHISGLLLKAHYRTMVFGHTHEAALFGDKGLLLDLPSTMISATMRSFVEIASKDSVKAGQMIVKTAEHLKDLQRLKEETGRKLRTSTDSMKMTALFFSPVVMGVTFSLYCLLVDTFGRVGSSGYLMGPDQFLVILGLYIVLMAGIVLYFVSGIERSESIERDYSVGTGVIISAAVFTLSCVLGRCILM